MGTVWPSLTLISFSTPAEGDGISASTLSVEISKSGSPRSTLSPAFLSHFVIVPSKMLSPIWGMMTSTAMVSPLRSKSGGAQALLVPDSGYAFERVDFIAAMEELDVLHFDHGAGMFQLLRFEIVVILAFLHEFLKERAIRYADLRSHFELRLVDTFRFSHGV